MSWGAQNRSKDAKLPVHRAAGPKNLNRIHAQSSHIWWVTEIFEYCENTKYEIANLLAMAQI
jgi:hypothetical protein